jgi:hypothetical protein
MKNPMSHRRGAAVAGGKKIDNLCELCVSVVNRNSDIITAEAQRTQRKEH